jgi:hypothetical protein
MPKKLKKMTILTSIVSQAQKVLLRSEMKSNPKLKFKRRKINQK